MRKEELKKLIVQARKYNLSDAFKNTKEFDKWLKRLSIKQIKNLNSLTVEPSEIMFPAQLLINKNLLNCSDYNKRVEAMSKLKNGDGCWHLFDRLCSLNFLNSKNYYQDMEMLSRANSIRYALWVIHHDNFINSKYHAEDLKLIVEAKDANKERGLDDLVAEALATVAMNVDSINSPYHQQDMLLIANSNSECLQMSHSYPERSLNCLATNKVSLNDKYHLENMRILSEQYRISKYLLNAYLYNLMTNPEFVNGPHYRYEIDALLNAKSEAKVVAIYDYISNPEEIRDHVFYKALYDTELDIHDIHLISKKNKIKGHLTPNYLDNLKLLNEIEDRFVMFFETLMSNQELVNSEYYDYDLNLLRTVTNKDIFVDLYQLMTNKDSLSGSYHIQDVNLISETIDMNLRKLLLEAATNIDSIRSHNHIYDMKCIAGLDFDRITNRRDIFYYLLDKDGINDKNHVQALEKLSKGERYDAVSEYLSDLEIELSSENVNDKVLSKTKQVLK